MIKNKIKLLYYFLYCQLMSGNKRWLNWKKKIIVMNFQLKILQIPPDLDELPSPKKNEENINQSMEIDEEIENLFKNSDEIDSSNNTIDTNQSAEEFVLKKINKN